MKIITHSTIISLFALLSVLFIPSLCIAQTVSIRVDVITKKMSASTKFVELLCSVSNVTGSKHGSARAAINNGEFRGYIDVPLDNITKPLDQYDDIQCELRLCKEATSGRVLCSVPINSTDSNKQEDLFKTYNETAFNQIHSEQTINSTTIVTAPPPSISFQTSGKKNTSNKNKRSGKLVDNISIGGTSDTVAAAEITLAASAAISTAQNAFSGIVTKASYGNVAGLVVGLVGFSGSKVLGMGGSTSGEIAGDAFGLGFSFLGGALATGTATATAGTALALAGVGLGAKSLTEKIDKALDGSGKKGNTAVLTALEFYFPYSDDSELDAQIRDILAAKKAAKDQEGDNKQPSSNTGTTGDKNPAAESIVENLHNRDFANRGNTSNADQNSNSNNNNQGNQGASSNTPRGGTTDNPDPAADSENIRNSFGQDVDPQNTANNSQTGTGVIIESHTNSDGSYGYTAMVYDEQGNYVDTIETTCVGGNCMSIGDNGKAEVHKDNNPGGAPQNGTTVSVSIGSSDSSGSGTNSNENNSDNGSDGGGDESGSDNGGDESGSDNGGDGCDEEGGSCDNDDDEAPVDDADDEENSDADTEADSTPSPDDHSNDRSAGIAWAMQNPNNPLAQQILKDTAMAISEATGYCQLGCADAMSDGGLLWAMLNPDNPVAQSILAAAAQSISSNSGSGQTGGPDDNIANEGDLQSTDYDMMQIELLLAGGGVVDPVEGNGTPPQDNPTTNPFTGGGAPISTGTINVGSPEDPDDDEPGGSPEDPDTSNPPPGNNPFSAETEVEAISDTSNIEDDFNNNPSVNTGAIRNSFQSQMQQ